MIKLLALALVICVNFNALSQTSQVKENVLGQLNDLILNGYELLGKTEYQIMSRGRPNSIGGGNIWNVTAKVPQVVGRYSKFINIETGSGALFTLYISSKTGLAYCISFTPLLWADFDDLNSFLKSKYTINDSGSSVAIKSNNDEFVSFFMEMYENTPYVNIYAADVVKNTYKFME